MRSLGDAAVTVLGNHDLHLLAAAAGVREPRRKDTLNSVLDADDREALLDWLRTRPLAHYDETLDTLMVHAGLPAHWSARDALDAASEVEQALQHDKIGPLLDRLYGDTPTKWSPKLSKHDRQRYTVNALTRMRFVREDGTLDFEHSGPPGTQPKELLPWFRAPGALKPSRPRVVFGHWAALRISETPKTKHRALATDTGCIWGGMLSAVRLEDERWFHVPSRRRGMD